MLAFSLLREAEIQQKLNLFVGSEPQRNLTFPSAGDLKVQAAKLIKGSKFVIPYFYQDLSSL